MIRNITLCVFLGTALSALGQLSPTVNAPLAQHLLEVNSQWRTMDPAALTDERTIAFPDEASRIAAHLHLVRERLSMNTPQQFTASQRANRSHLLQRLGRYADGGRFPQNHVLPFRNPIFLDPQGIACAVGQLIIESGHRDLAERISLEMNQGYVLDMAYPELGIWADDHGFTAQELAWIQPGYPPNLPWQPLGGGTDDNVTVMLELSNGDLLLGGDFTAAGSVDVNRVAIWNGTSFIPLGSGIPGFQGRVNCAVEFNGDLYVGGVLLNGIYDLAKWDGTNWTFSTVFDGKLPAINALHVHNGELYAAGEFQGFAGVDDAVLRMTPSGWMQVGATFNNTVRALASHDGMLVAGGSFTGPDSPADPTFLYVAYFAGDSWAQIGNGLDATVRTLLDVDGTLYAGGELYANIAVTFGLARVAAGESLWEPLLPNHVNYIYQNLGPTWVGSLVEHDGAVYFGGDFFFESGLIGFFSYNLLRFDGDPDAVTPMIGFLNGAVNALAIHDQKLVIGGDFDTPFAHAAILDLTTGVNTIAAHPQLHLSPNPATDVIWVRSDIEENAMIVVTDVAGKQVTQPVRMQGAMVPISLTGLGSGTYFITAISGEGRSVQRLVKN